MIIGIFACTIDAVLGLCARAEDVIGSGELMLKWCFLQLMIFLISRSVLATFLVIMPREAHLPKNMILCFLLPA